MIRNTVIVILFSAYCVMVVVTCISYVHSFQWSYSRSNVGRTTVDLVDGGFYVTHINANNPSNLEHQTKIESLLPRRYDLRTSAGPPAPCIRFGCPGVFIFFLLGLYPGIAFLRGPARRWHRRRRGLCEQCGYNLAGNTTGVCPECGSKMELPQRGIGA